jgi:PAS domain S-box-containing protein
LLVSEETAADDERTSDNRESTVLLISARGELSASLRGVPTRADAPFSVRSVSNQDDAVRTLTEREIACIVSEYDLPETNGLALFEELRAIDPDVPFVLYPTEHDDRTAKRAIDADVAEYLPQSADTSEHDVLVCAIRRALDARRAPGKPRHRDERPQLSRAIDAAGHAVFITDPTGTIEYVNAAFEEITGYSASFAIGATPRILKSGKMPEAYYSTLWETIRAGNVWSEPIINRRQSGGLYHAEETIAPFTDDTGVIEGFIAVQTDVTERVETREELETFKRIVQRVDDPIMIQDADGRFELANDAVGEYAGVSNSDLIGTDEFAFMDRAAAEAVAERKRQVMANRRPETYELQASFPTKGERSFVTTRYPKRGESGEVDGTIAICRDITEQLERERQLRILVRILRHNINNKMSIILGNAGIVRERLVDADADAAIADRIIDAGQELVTLAETKRKIVGLLVDPPKNRPVEVVATLERIVADASDRFPESAITVDAPAAMRAMAVPQLDEAITELIENAVVHADGSEPTVEITVRSDRETDEVTITVADDGPGIPEIEREVLATDAELSQTHHGRGLGLRFADQVLRASHGALEILDAPDGAVVELRLAAAPSDDGG